MRPLTTLLLVALLILGTSGVQAQRRPAIGVRAGVGTDINLGIAYGAGGNYLIQLPYNAVELGIVIFGGSFDETTTETYTYEETTDIFVFGMLANYLIGYTPGESAPFFVAGLGLASVSIDWEERSDGDTSLGRLLPDGGSMQSESGSVGGSVFNLGAGYSFKGGFDVRVEAPVIVAFSPPGGATGVMPTLIVTAGFRF